MSGIVRTLDPKLERFRPPKRSKPYVPKNRRDFELLIKRTPDSILSERKRELIRALIDIETKTAQDLMTPRAKMSVLHEGDELSLFTLDRLSKSGSKCFPVLNKEGQAVGLIRAKDFDISKISENDKLEPYIDKNVFYVRAEYSVAQLLSVFLRCESGYALVVDDRMKIIGSVSADELFSEVFDFMPDDFYMDNDSWSVANRRI